jgi:rSAM/selenodomain-associated transferase 2
LNRREIAVPALAIVLPALDEAASIEPTLRALQPLRQRGVAVVVVDGGSRDGTTALAAPLADQVLAAPRGRARQMNAGAQAVRSADAMLFLHADTHLPDGADALVLAALSGARRWGRFDVRIDGRSRWLPLVAALMNARSRLSGIATGDQALFMTRAAFEAVGGFPDQPLMEDVEICRRLKRAAGPPACLRARVVTSGRRWDRHGAWRTIALMWRLRWAYWRGASAQSLAERYR